jgi:DegV family protein with EDD domain
MRQGKRITTAQVSVEEFLRIFEEYLSRGMDIVYIACSSKQSGSVNTGSVVARRVLEKYPEGKIHCIDSLNASMGEGMLAVEAAKLAEAGLGADEIADRITAIRKTVNQYVTVHSLDALRRAGRVKGPAAFFGNLMGVKPIIISDVNGYQTAFKKVKGREKSLREIVAMLADSIVEPEEQTLYFAHADCEEEEVESIVAMLREAIPARRIVVGYIGPIIGASIGPDAVAIFGFGKPVTFNQGE